jgi:hypothetical protein
MWDVDVFVQSEVTLLLGESRNMCGFDELLLDSSENRKLMGE